MRKLIKSLSEIRPAVLYVMSDGPRDDVDKKLVEEVRMEIENQINWDCAIHKMYSKQNVGVYENIAVKIKEFFSENDFGIFLEEDNLPTMELMDFMSAALERYESDDEVLWINGSNLLLSSDFGGYIGGFTTKLQPCGWASWGRKFLKHYNWNFDKWGDRYYRKRIISNFSGVYLRVRYFRAFSNEYENQRKGKRYSSWDHHMYLSLLENNLLGFLPCVNLIENTGVDERSEHGGSSLDLEGTNFYAPKKNYEIDLGLPYPKISDVRNFNNSFDRSFDERTSFGYGVDYKIFYILVVRMNSLILYRIYTLLMKILRR